MIARTYMQENLRRLDRLYSRAKSPKESLFYAKLAILELCGWIEESMDDVVMRCSIRALKDPKNRKFVEESIIKRTHGFDYDRHFREMLVKLIGLTQVEKLELRVEPVRHAKLKSTLASLYLARNAEAHTHLKGMTRVINAPSVTISQFNDVYLGLVEYDAALRKFVT